MLRNSLRSFGFFALSLTLGICPTKAQDFLNPSITQGNIYALIVGISDYQDEKIKDLSFAHRDAEAFADYLSSPAGGSVPSENISFLVNEEATIGNIYAAKRNIQSKASKDDLVYIYFSGHGAIEEFYESGFFLAYDTPFQNYLTNAIRILDINNMANVLSTKLDVKVVVITDACHSGKISSPDEARALHGELLSKSESNEIRIASCESDQFSQEGEAWGNGRGVFSYYLINGLKGMAEMGDPDGIITLSEIRMYLEQKIPSDVAKIKAAEQVPVIAGKGMSVMSIIDEEEKAKVKAEVDLSRTSTISKSVGYDPSIADQYFDSINQIKLIKELDFGQWRKYSSKYIVKKALETFTPYENDAVKNSAWRKSLETDTKKREEYGVRLASVMHNQIQGMVNAFIDGTRVKFNSNEEILEASRKLEKCAFMLETAHKLVDTKDYLYKIIGVKKHWFRGVAYRLEAPLSENPKEMKRKSHKEIKRALDFESDVTYVNIDMNYSSKKTVTKRRKTKKIITKKRVVVEEK